MRQKTKIKIKNTILAIIVSVVAIFVPSLILNKWVEGITFFVCHWFIREQFPKQYHATSAVFRSLGGLSCCPTYRLPSIPVATTATPAPAVFSARTATAKTTTAKTTAKGVEA